MQIVCPKCGRRAKRSKTKYGYKNSCCDLWSWGNSPLVDEDTHKARRKAHIAFDPLWKSGAMTRSSAYRALQRKMKMSSKQCHMKVMTRHQASLVPEKVKLIISTLDDKAKSKLNKFHQKKAQEIADYFDVIT